MSSWQSAVEQYEYYLQWVKQRHVLLKEIDTFATQIHPGMGLDYEFFEVAFPVTQGKLHFHVSEKLPLSGAI